MRPVSRRSFLLGSAAAAVTLTACGGSSSGGAGGAGSAAPGGSGNAPDETAAAGGTQPGSLVLIQRFASKTLTTGRQRVPIVLGDVNGLLPLEQTPTSLTARIVDGKGAVAVPAVSVKRHGDSLQQPYYPFALTLQVAGTYELQLVDTPGVATAVDVSVPGDVPIPQVGSPLPPEATPTEANHRGVNPICTRQPACPLHDVTLQAALGQAKPVAYLIGTPAYCQTGICGPVLDLLLAEHLKRSDFTMVHAEVYTDDTINTPAPAVTAYHLNFEPCLFIANAKGVITARLDSIWDAEELSAALATATA